MALELTRHYTQRITVDDMGGDDANAETLVSVAGDNMMVLVDKIILANITGGSLDVSGFVVLNGESAGDSNAIMRDVAIGANTTTTLTFPGGIGLRSGDEIRFGTTAANSIIATAICREFKDVVRPTPEALVGPHEPVRHYTVHAQAPDTDFTLLAASAVATVDGLNSTIVVDSLTVCNTTADPQVYTILFSEAKSGQTFLPTSSMSLYRSVAIAANTTVVIPFETGLPMNGDNSNVRIGSSTADAITVTAACHEVLFNDGE